MSAIVHENQRSEALIAFAPHLEYAQEDTDYPALLEKTHDGAQNVH